MVLMTVKNENNRNLSLYGEIPQADLASMKEAIMKEAVRVTAEKVACYIFEKIKPVIDEALPKIEL